MKQNKFGLKIFFNNLFRVFLVFLTINPVVITATQNPKIGITILDKALSQNFESLLTAELYHQLGDSTLGVEHYMKIALINDDPDIAKRATEIASRSMQLAAGLTMSKRWIELAPNNLQARQYLALLLLRNKQFQQSSNQLSKIIELVEKSSTTEHIVKPLYSKGLKFIGAMLLIESHHDDALSAFDAFLKKTSLNTNMDYQGQKYLIRASLAEKAQNQRAIIDAINSYEESSDNLLIEVIVMKVKAFQKLEHINEALSYLTPIIDNKKGNDSLQLELVRLLILDNQKHRAAPYLKTLVSKHPDNNDLLKSLIALQIDQKELSDANANIDKLKQSIEYDNDARYFSAEVLEARGNIALALEKYKKVKAGSLLKSAKKKIKQLTLLLNKNSKKRVNYLKNSN